MAGSKIFNNLSQEEDLLFWIVVQACKDIVNYDGRPGGPTPKKAFLHACEWIVDELPQQIGDREFTFTEALLELGVHPENIVHIRDAILRGPLLSNKEKMELARHCYAKLEGQDNQEPWWRCLKNNILTVQEGEDEES